MTDNQTTGIEARFWDEARQQWNGHAAFNTVSHKHVSCYLPADNHDPCDLTIVECADGRWFVEDNWGTDANGDDKVWNPTDRHASPPYFFDAQDEALAYAVSVIARISGVPASAVGVI